MNLSIEKPIATAITVYVAGNRRAGRRTVSELTTNLWIAYLRKHGQRLPECAVLKNGKAKSK